MIRSSAIFIGKSRVTVVPAPTWLFTATRPPIRSIVERTTSMPTPRPETAETSGCRGKAGGKYQVDRLLVGEGGEFVLGQQPPSRAPCGGELRIDPAAVIRNFDDQPVAGPRVLAC